jgi:hypothetical protein
MGGLDHFRIHDSSYSWLSLGLHARGHLPYYRYGKSDAVTQSQKIQITIPLATLGLTALMLSFFHGRDAHRNFILSRASEIGRYLLVSTNSDRLVSIGPDLQHRLGSSFASAARIEAVRLGDEPAPIGDRQALCRLFLINWAGERVAVRLRQASDSDKFLVLGFWTPDSEHK